jgi:hypothetical protein
VVGYQNEFLEKVPVNIVYPIQDADPAYLQEGFFYTAVTGGESSGQDHPGAGKIIF